MKKLMLLSIALVLTTGSLLKASDPSKESLLIKNMTKKDLSYNFVTPLKAKSPTKEKSGEIGANTTFAFQPKEKVAIIEFYTDGGKTVEVETTTNTGYIVVKEIKKNDIKFTKSNDEKNPSTVSFAVTIK